MTYIVKADLVKRVSASVVAQVFQDDVADAALNAFIADAESLIEQRVAKIYGTSGLVALRALGTSAPRAVKRLCLDALECMVGSRHPEYIRGDWDTRYERLYSELKSLSAREVQLDTETTPEPAVTDGVDYNYSDPEVTDMPNKIFADGMGCF